ncbi:MAG: beta-ketoacyl-ACP synthase II [Verrucomicrobiota bacterium]
MSSPNANQRVVVTGIGVIAGLGQTGDEFFDNLVAGKSGIGRVTRFDATDYPSQVGAEASQFEPTDFIEPKEVRRNDRYTQFAIGASRRAVEDGSLDLDKVDKDRFGVLIGSGIGGMETIENQSFALFQGGPRKVSPFMIPSLIANMATGVVAIDLGARGPNFSVVSACATGSHALGEAYRMIQRGEADVMIAGGSEAAITRLGYGGFCKMKAMSTRYNATPEKASRPFDSGRDGFVMGEGAGVLILETLEHAEARNAKVYCEMVGYSATCDAYHITSPDPEGKGLALALRNALNGAGLEPTDVDYINAHGTSTPYNDKFETQAVKNVFGDHAKDKLLMSSTKSMTGHLLGAAGGIEAAVIAKTIETGKVAPTINIEDPDPECDLNYVPNTSVEAEVKVAMSNNLGFGGHNATIIFKAID